MQEIERMPDNVPAYLVVPYPMYVSIDKAARISGLSKDDIAAFVCAEVNPLEHIRTGKHGGRVLVRVSAIEPYLERRKFTNVSK